MEYLIRKCEEKDLPVLVRFCQSHAAYEQTAYEASGKEDLLKKALFSATPRLFGCLIEQGRQPVGYFTYTFDFSTWDAQEFLYLDCLYLEPDYRGYGLGEKVFDLLKSIALENHCVNIQWQTPEFNTRAIAFYRRMGGQAKAKMRFIYSFP